MLFQKKSYLSFILASSFIVAGCTTNSAIEIEIDALPTPENWSDKNVLTEKVNSENNQQWLLKLMTPELLRNIDLALMNNRTLKQQRLSVEIAEQSVIVSGATLWPSLDLNLSASKRDYSVLTTSNDLSLALKYEFDIWGKLGAAERQVNLNYAALLAQYEQRKRELISNVILGWYQVIEQNQQLSLAEASLKSIEENLSIIEASYNSGLNTSLDVYLARNDVASERSKVATQKTSLNASIRSLELLLGKYPSAALQAGSDDIPELNQTAAGVPSEIVANNPQLQYMWNLLLAEDAGLAYAHKQRFPSLSLTASTGASSAELSDLLSSDLGWSLVGNLTTPIFNAGRLAANEQSARLKTKQAEQAYLETLYSTFSTIENSLTQTDNLQLSYQANIDAADNATLAEEVSFEQYLKGLVSYTTVLDAQSRAFSAQSSVIQLKYEMLNTRLQLFTALGGDFSSILSLSKDVK